MAKKPAKHRKSAASTKSQIITALLKRPNGASVAELAKAADWQAHSVRGFLSGTLKNSRLPVGNAQEEEWH
jgi:uncharacterized alpha-E superfamily protein